MERISKKSIELGREELLGVRIKLGEVKNQLDAAYRNFNASTESELIDASIYEINALDAKYSWLLCTAKSKNEALRRMEDARRRPRKAEERA